MVSVELPVGVLPVVVMVKEELPDEVIEDGEKAPVVPVGNPVTPRLTVPVNPPVGVTFTP